MSIQLTERAVARMKSEATATGKRIEASDAGLPGLRLRVTPPSKRDPRCRAAWFLMCRDRMGAMRRFPLGAYGDRPDTELGLADARRAAEVLRVQVRENGSDPTAERKRDRAIGRDARAGVGTLQAELDRYEAAKGCRLKSWAHSRKRVSLVFRELLDRPVTKLTPTDLQAAAESYPAQQSAAFAVRTIRPALKWLAQRRHVPADLSLIVQPVTVNRRANVLGRDELARLLPVLAASPTAHAAALRLILLTATRLTEATSARWRDVDLNGATLTLPETKNGTTHIVPLSKQAVSLLRGRKPANAQPDALVFHTASGTALGNWDRAGKAFGVASKTAGWHRHDLRRTSATLLGEMGVAPHVIESVLNHAVVHNRLASVYNTARYTPEAADALQRLADSLDSLCGTKGTETPPATQDSIPSKAKKRKARSKSQPS